jgi:hypothetical protein
MAFDPDAQLFDWYGWLCTQAGHSVLVGVPAALALLPWFGPFVAPLIVAVVYLVAWEIKHQRIRAGWKDALEDTACVMSGASILCGAFVSYGTSALAFLLWAVFLAAGVIRRA